MQPVLFTLSTPTRGQRSVRGAVAATPPCYSPLPVPVYNITGVSRDGAGAPLGGMRCTLFRVDTDNDGVKTYTQIMWVISDGSGNYSFPVGFAENYRVTTDLTGSPNKAGISLDTLIGT